MSEFIFKLPDLGEGTVEAEIVEWHVKPGDAVQQDAIIVDVMTDKANVEVPAPVSGTVLRTTGEPGDVVAVGAELIAFDAAADASASQTQTQTQTPRAEAPQPVVEPPPPPSAPPSASPSEAPSAAPAEPPTSAEPAPEPAVAPQVRSERVITSPAIRKSAAEAGVDLALVPGSGPRGRILRKDLDAYLAGAGGAAAAPARAGLPASDGEEVKVIGIRRVIAGRMSESKRNIPHFTYVEEIDVTATERLRRTLNERDGAASLTILPFIATALMRALPEFPMCNAHYDQDSGVLKRFAHVHLGIATQTPDGLKVPVVHHAERLSVPQLAAEIARVSGAARDGTAGRDALTGSTITITSLGRLGGIVTTPVINLPEVGIIGVNKAVPRPVVVDGEVTVRTMMNLSSSFDHRFVDGFDAASLVQRIKTLLEEPALMFGDFS